MQRRLPQEWVSQALPSSTAVGRGGLQCVRADEGLRALKPVLMAVMEPTHPSGGELFTGSRGSSWEEDRAPPLHKAAAAVAGPFPRG